MIKLRNNILKVLSLGTLLLLSGCNAVVMNPKGIIAEHEKHLFFIALTLMLIIVVPVIILTIVIARRYRASNTNAKYTPDWAHNNWLEFVWWLVPAVIITVLAIITWISAHRLDPYRPLQSNVKPITIEVISLDWRWLFIYPDQNIATINFVQFPVNTPVTFLITSTGPMNSFQIPQLAGQIYAMAGMRTQLHLMGDTIGDYDGRSTNFSGDGFADMTFVARVSSQDDFNKWVQSAKQSPNALSMATFQQLVQPSEDETVQYFSSVENNLFNNEIMSFMMPMSSTSNAGATTPAPAVVSSKQ
ncbi:MAG: ubiquinol oxidase subunit II [Gammaproteobacteria bacterium]